MAKEEMVAEKVVKDFEEGKISRRQLVRALAIGMMAAAAGRAAVPAPVAPDMSSGKVPAPRAEWGKLPSFAAINVNHISYQSLDYARTRDFYHNLLRMAVPFDTGDQCYLQFGFHDSPQGETTIHCRRTNWPRHQYIDHFAFTIADWDRDKIFAGLQAWGFHPTADSKYGWTVHDPDGFPVQLIAKEHNSFLLEECGGYMQGCPKTGDTY